MVVSPSHYPIRIILSGVFEIVEDSFCFLAFILLLSLLMVRNLIITNLFEGKGPTSPWFRCLSAQLWL